MNNEIEHIIDLFDEFILVPEKDSPLEKVTETAPVEEQATTEVQSVSEPALNNQPAPDNHAPILVSPSPISVIPLNFSGANKRHIVFIYNDKVNDARENVEMLSNLITKALKFSMEDVAVVRLSKNPEHNLHTIIDALKPHHLLLFGVPEWITDEVTVVHNVIKVNDTHVLIADNVEAYHGRQEHKSALWSGIQQLLSY